MVNNNEKQLYKIVLSALFISFSIVLGYFSQYLFRFSLRNSFLIFSSLLLGPIYGAIISFAEDILYNLFFNSMGIYWIDLNIVYTIKGAFPYLCLLALNAIDKNKKYRFALLSFIVISIELLMSFFIFNLFEKDIEKISIIFFNSFSITKTTIFLILSGFIIFFYLFLTILNIFFIKKRKINNNYNIDLNGFAIAAIITIIIFDLIFFSFIRTIHQEVSFEICLIQRINFTIKHLFLDTFIVLILFVSVNRNIKKTNQLLN